MVLLLTVVCAAALVAALLFGRPSTFLFDMLNGCFSHGQATHRR